MPHRRIVAVLSAVVVVLSAACGADTESRASDGSPATVVYTIPAGAGEAIDAGEQLDILPEHIELAVGDSVEITNEDERNHLVGPFFVEAGQTFHHTFSSPGEFEGECSVHPSGRVVVTIA